MTTEDPPIDPANPCGGCKARCCKGEQIWLMPEYGDVVEDYTRLPGINPLTGREGYFVPQTPMSNRCVYLGEDDLCSIYEHRPAICRTFTCWSVAAEHPIAEQVKRVIAGTASAAVYNRGRRVLIAMGKRT